MVYNISISNNKPYQNDRVGSIKNPRQRSGGKVFILLFLFIFLLFGLGYYIYKYAKICPEEGCESIFNPIVATVNPKLNQTDGLTNILLVGIDTREKNPGLMNTDTIIILTIDHNNKTAVMTSIPRDLWVKYKLPNGNTTGSKINSAYASGEWVQKGKGMETLIGVVENIMGVKIHYHVKVTLKAFVDIVDKIGGVDIYLDAPYTDGYPSTELPSELAASCRPYYHDGKYCLFTFDKGENHLNGQMALIYSRMRLLSPMGDFDRARRQQQVLNAIKMKALSSETLLDPTKLWDLYNIVKDNVETSPFTINDIRAFINLKDEIDINNIANVVIDPNFGNIQGKYVYRPTDDLSKGYYIIARDQTYKDIQKLLGYIRKYPGVYNEATKISIYNATGNKTLDRDWIKELEAENPLFIVQNVNKILQNPNEQYKNIKIYKFAKSEKPNSEKFLKKFFGVDEIITEIDDGTKPFYSEDYVIVIGKSVSEE